MKNIQIKNLYKKYNFLKIYDKEIINDKIQLKGKLISYELTIKYFINFLQNLIRSENNNLYDFIPNYLNSLYTKINKKISFLFIIIFSLEKYLNKSLFLIIIQGILKQEFDFNLIKKLIKINNILQFEEKKNLDNKLENWDNYLININTLYLILTNKFNFQEDDILLINQELKKFILKNRNLINNKITYNLKNISISLTIFILLKLFKKNKLNKSLIDSNYLIYKEINYYKILLNTHYSFISKYKFYLNKIKIIEKEIINKNQNFNIENYEKYDLNNYYNDILRIKDNNIFNDYDKYNNIVNEFLDNKWFSKLQNNNQIYKILFNKINDIYKSKYFKFKNLSSVIKENSLTTKNKKYDNNLFIYEYNNYNYYLLNLKILDEKFFKKEKKLDKKLISFHEMILKIIKNYDKSIYLDQIKNKINSNELIKNKNNIIKLINWFQNSIPQDDLDLEDYLYQQNLNLLNNLKKETDNIENENIEYYNILKKFINNLKINFNENSLFISQTPDNEKKYKIFDNLLKKLDKFYCEDFDNNKDLEESKIKINNDINELFEKLNPKTNNLKKSSIILNKSLNNNTIENSKENISKNLKNNLLTSKINYENLNLKESLIISRKKLHNDKLDNSFELEGNYFSNMIDKELLNNSLSNNLKEKIDSPKIKINLIEDDINDNLSISRKFIKLNTSNKLNSDRSNTIHEEELKIFEDKFKSIDKSEESNNTIKFLNESKKLKKSSIMESKILKKLSQEIFEKYNSAIKEIMDSDPNLNENKKEKFQSKIKNILKVSLEMEELKKRIKFLEDELELKDKLINKLKYNKRKTLSAEHVRKKESKKPKKKVKITDKIKLMIKKVVKPNKYKNKK